QLIREALEQADLVLGQGSARTGDGVLDARAVGGDDIKLAFHQDCVALAGDVVPRQVEPENDPTLDVCGGFGRVDVLALLIRPHGPRGEGQWLASLVT